MRRLLTPALLAATVLGLSACATGDATFSGPDEETGEVTGGQAEELPALDCAEPPAAPSSPLSFTQDDLPEPMSGDPATVTATVETTCGDIELELLADKAPQTVASFAFLAEEGYWDDSACHRLTTQGIFVLQCGDPTGTGRGNPGYGFGIENAPEDGAYPPGTLAMARAQDPESNGGQFFIVYEDTTLPVQGGGYTVFGEVTSGLDIVQALAAEGVQGGGGDGAPTQPISILSVTVDD